MLAWLVSAARWVLEEDADCFQRASGQVGVDGARVVHREDPGDQRLDLDVLTGDEIEKAFEVAAFGPPDIARGVVDAVDLVPGIVPSRPVGPGEPDVELLVVVGVPRQVQAGLADVHDAGPVPGQAGGGFGWPVG